MWNSSSIRYSLLVTNILIAADVWGGRGGGGLVLLTISTALVWWSWKRLDRPTSWSKLIAAGFLLICIVGLLWPSLVGCITVFGSVGKGLASLGVKVVGQDFLIVSLILSGILYGVFRCTKGGGDWRFLLVVSVVFLLLKGLYILLIHMEATSDFARLWQFAERSVSRGLPSTRGAGLLYLGRTVLYYTPLQHVFGTSPAVYTVANVFVTSACSVLVFLWTRACFGSRAARIACVVSLLSIEVWLASGIPTHDIPGAFFTLLALSCFSQAAWQLPTHPYRAALYSLGFGLLVVMVDLQRNTGPILLVACLLIGAASVAERYWQMRQAENSGWKPIASTLVVLLFLPLIASKVFEYPVQKAGWTVSGSTRPEWVRKRMFTNLAAHTDSWGAGTNWYWKEHWSKRDMPLDRWPYFIRRKLLSDIYLNPLGRVRHYHRKASSLFRLGNQTLFYVRGASVWGGGSIDQRLEQRILLLNNVFTVVFLGFLVVGSLSVWKHTTRMSVALLPMVYMSLLSGALIFLSEVQPRYLFQIWFIGAMYIGALFRDESDCSDSSAAYSKAASRAESC